MTIGIRFIDVYKRQGCSNDIKETDIQFTGDTGAKVSFSAVINNHEASNLVTRATAVSYTHLDVYKRQGDNSITSTELRRNRNTVTITEFR